MNAHELADALDWVCENHLIRIGDVDFKATAIMLRQQADRIAHLEMLVANRNEIIDKLDLKPETKPLSDEEIKEIVKEHFIGGIKLGIVMTNDNVLNFARSIEERHGIK